MTRVPEREEEADGDGLGVDLAQGLEVERAKHPLRTDPLGDSEAALQRHQRLGVVLAEPIEMRSRLPAEVEEVLEPLGRDEGRPRALALEQRVRGDGRPVREALDVLGADRAGGGEHGLLLACGGRHLRGRDPAIVDEDGVRESAANVDAENAHLANVRGAKSVRRDMTELKLVGGGGETGGPASDDRLARGCRSAAESDRRGRVDPRADASGRRQSAAHSRRLRGSPRLREGGGPRPQAVSGRP